MSSYWQDRMAQSQSALTTKTITETNKQIAKYYNQTSKRLIREFEATYNKILAQTAAGKQITPALLYQLDSYWQMQGQIKKELQKLGDKEIALLSKKFVTQFEDIYNSIALPSGSFFSTVSKENVEQMINQIWCADGKSWSSRVWTNTEKLADALNEGLIHCATTGAKSSYLKQTLQNEFDVSHSRAEALVRTEMAHIQTQAATQRYKDYGVKEVEVLADEDERRCKICGKLHEKRFLINEPIPIPAHTNCRCCIVPIIETKKEEQPIIETTKKEEKFKNKFNQDIEIDDLFKDEKWAESISLIKKLTNEYDTRLTRIEIKPNDVFFNNVNMGGRMQLGSTQKIIAIHEFAHTINIEKLAKYKVEDTEDFWNEIRKIRRKYKKDVGDDTSRWISSYANTNIDEFMAEAFTHAKLKELNLEVPNQYGNDFTYSDEVLAAVNKYFKKKKKR